MKHAILHLFLVTAVLSATATALVACGPRTEATRSSDGPITTADAAAAAHSSDAEDDAAFDAGCGLSCATFLDCLPAEPKCNDAGDCPNIPVPKCIKGKCVIYDMNADE